jgi:hypothetical protein
MTEDQGPPWREIITEDYYPKSLRRSPGLQAWNTAYTTVQDLIARQRKGELRLRLVLRETHDLLPGSRRNPLRVEAYEFGPPAILSAGEVVLITKDGQRHLVDRANLPPHAVSKKRQTSHFTGLD